MPIKIETPPTLTGQSDSQLKQLVSYLYRLSENLNIALNSIEYTDNRQTLNSPASAVYSHGAADPNVGTAYNELRALIDNTAKYVRVTEMKLERELASSYQAISDDFGTFAENISTTMAATARDVVASYNYDSRITALDEAAAGFSEYQAHTEGFIRQGFIDYDEYGAPIIGIAIGQNLTSTDVTIDGKTYKRFDQGQSCAFYTSEKVSFRINGQEVAYFSNSRLYINDADITGTMSLGNKWMVIHDNGLAIKWIGA